MLETIKKCIEDLPDKSFPDYYQEYVMEAEQRVMQHRINIDSHRFVSIDNMSDIIAGLNQMTEELKTL